MANREKGEVSLTLSGTTYTCKLGTQALIEAQEALSTPARLVTLEEMQAGMLAGRVKFIQVMLWASLQKYHPGLTLEDVNDLLDGADEQEVRVLMGALGLTMRPAPEDATELREGVATDPPRAQAKRGAGARSTLKRVASA